MSKTTTAQKGKKASAPRADQTASSSDRVLSWRSAGLRIGDRVGERPSLSSPKVGTVVQLPESLAVVWDHTERHPITREARIPAPQRIDPGGFFMDENCGWIDGEVLLIERTGDGETRAAQALRRVQRQDAREALAAKDDIVAERRSAERRNRVPEDV